MGSEVFFYDQTSFRKPPKRFRKLPEDLPESLKFAHLNPKLAAYMASKEKQKAEEDLFGDGLGKKSLMPEINLTFHSVKNRLDTTLINDEDSQRYLFEESKGSARGILAQLARIIYFYEDIASHIPKSLEYQLMMGFKELTTDVIIVPREWQTLAMKESFLRQQQLELLNSDDDKLIDDDVRSVRPVSVRSMTEDAIKVKKKKANLPEIVEDDLKGDGPKPGGGGGGVGGGLLSVPMTKRSDSKVSIQSKAPKSRAGNERPGLERSKSQHRGSANALASSYYMSSIQFQLSSKQCEEKGWIVQSGNEEEIDQSTLLEWCLTILQQCMRIINEQREQERQIGHNKPVQLRCYGDSRKDTLMKYRKQPTKAAQSSPLQKGFKPRIPSLPEDTDGRKKMLVSHIDGTTTVYYPSGRPAVVHVAAGFGFPGYYTLVYDDDPTSRMLACFTPSGKGVCYHSNGVVRFVATDTGGHIADVNGSLVRQWRWPADTVKITHPVVFQMNDYLMFRCISQVQMSLHFSCQKENAKFSMSPVPGAVEPKPGDENEQLLTALDFSSHAARDLLRLFSNKPKSLRSSKIKKKERLKTHVVEAQQMLDLPDMSDFDPERDLARLQRKARILIDDWMEHYRIAIGLIQTQLVGVREAPCTRRRYAQSAKLSSSMPSRHVTTTTAEEGATEGLDEAKKRLPSAPAGVFMERAMASKRVVSASQHSVSSRRTTSSPVRSGRHSAVVHSATVKFENVSTTTEQTSDCDRISLSSPSAIAVIRRLSESARTTRSSSLGTKTPIRQHSLTLNDRFPSASAIYRGACPLALRQQLLGQERPQCRCGRHSIPYISDVEYDEYINREAPPGQLQVIAVVSSAHPQANTAEDLMNQIYSLQNRNRTRPCMQLRSDTFRILKYDISTAANNSKHTNPLLLTRHNVIPGMFLIYCDGKLLFCDHIFNGYGYTRKDFHKQVMKSRWDFMHGYRLPKDFKFSPARGRHGPRSAWGGEIGGPGLGASRDQAAAQEAAGRDSDSEDLAPDKKGIWLHLGPVLGMPSKRSSQLPSLPPIVPRNASQREGEHSQVHKHEPVPIKLPPAF